MEIKDLLEDVKAYRNTMVARNFPYQEITNLIMKWDQKLLENTPEYKVKIFEQRMKDDAENLEKIAKEAREKDAS